MDSQTLSLTDQLVRLANDDLYGCVIMDELGVKK